MCGPKGKHDRDRTVYRHGTDDGTVTLGGRCVEVERPRMRTKDGDEEVPLRTYQHSPLLCGAALRNPGHRLAVHRDRRRLRLRLGGAANLRAQPALPALPAVASPRRRRAQGGRLETAEVTTDNGSEFRSKDFGQTVSQLGARQRFIKAGRPNSNGSPGTEPSPPRCRDAHPSPRTARPPHPSRPSFRDDHQFTSPGGALP